LQGDPGFIAINRQGNDKKTKTDVVASAGIEPASEASEALILSPSDWRQPGGHCNYEANLFFKNLLPAADLKYFSLAIASGSVSKASK
jgi:hypothetical protein